MEGCQPPSSQTEPALPMSLPPLVLRRSKCHSRGGPKRATSCAANRHEEGFVEAGGQGLSGAKGERAAPRVGNRHGYLAEGGRLSTLLTSWLSRTSRPRLEPASDQRH